MKPRTEEGRPVSRMLGSSKTLLHPGYWTLTDQQVAQTFFFPGFCPLSPAIDLSAEVQRLNLFQVMKF